VNPVAGAWCAFQASRKKTRRLHRELGRLKREGLAHRMRVQSLLVTQAIKVSTRSVLRLQLGSLTLRDGRALPAELKSELERETERLALVERQIGQLEAARRERLLSPRTEAERRIVHLGAWGRSARRAPGCW
jgi:transposase